MATQTVKARQKNVQSLIKKILATPMNQMDETELSLVSTITTFGDAPNINLETRDLQRVSESNSFEHLLNMICVVESYNDYNPSSLCKVLEKHKDFIRADYSAFGRDCSPVLYLCLNEDDNLFTSKANALWKDLMEIAECDDVAWCAFSRQSNGDYKPDKVTALQSPVKEGDKIVSYKEVILSTFRFFRVWWD